MRDLDEIKLDVRKAKSLRASIDPFADDKTFSLGKDVEMVTLDAFTNSKILEKLRFETVKSVLELTKTEGGETYAKKIMSELNPLDRVDVFKDSCVNFVDFNCYLVVTYGKLECCLQAIYDSRTVDEAKYKAHKNCNYILGKKTETSELFSSALAIAKQDGYVLEDKHL